MERLREDAKPDPVLAAVYGDNAGVLQERKALWMQTLRRFADRFGDQPVRLFRSPGRINLRGMHVDTHGGFLNLMTHQRETVIVAAASAGSMSVFTNIESCYGDVLFDLRAEHAGADSSWTSFISRPWVKERIESRRAAGMDWANYVIGASLAAVAGRGEGVRGMVAAVGSDLPRGAALSSSAALCVAVLQAASAINGMEPDAERLIRAEQDAEWYAGARVGMSDQGAMLLGRRGKMLNIALFSDDFSLNTAKYTDLPLDSSVLVVNSHTKRSLSGSQLVEYTRNRFAYSVAMHVLRRVAAELGFASETVAGLDRLSRLAPENLGGREGLYGILKEIPEEMSLPEMKARYAPPDFDEAYERYFGTVPEELRPARIRLRGPLAFGMAESERARRFAELAAEGNLEEMGELMNIGHNGDRVVTADGNRYSSDLSDQALEEMQHSGLDIARCPGAYGASSPVLDLLVDRALSAGALGACLTGAGIAGAVLVLCRKADTEKVAQGLRDCLVSEEYRRRGGRAELFTESELREAVVVNQSVEGAGELRIGATT
jgi:galactokinase